MEFLKVRGEGIKIKIDELENRNIHKNRVQKAKIFESKKVEITLNN